VFNSNNNYKKANEKDVMRRRHTILLFIQYAYDVKMKKLIIFAEKNTNLKMVLLKTTKKPLR
jgi:hypothetical protein